MSAQYVTIETIFFIQQSVLTAFKDKVTFMLFMCPSV